MAITLSRTPEDDRVETPCWGEQETVRRGWAFDDIFKHQFRIGPKPAVSSQSWHKHRLGSLWIEHCPDLPVTEIRSRRGTTIGVCLGIAVGKNGEAYGAKESGPIIISAKFEAVERLQNRLAGRYVLICLVNGEARIYPDACASQTFVYNSSQKCVATTTTLALNGPLIFPSKSGDADLGHEPLFMGDTRDRRITQAYANHYVRLSDFTSHRFWPADDTDFSEIPKSSQAAELDHISARLQQVVCTLIDAFPTTLPITGGSDSRMLAAAGATSKTAVRTYYVHEINWASSFDVLSAKGVAAHLDVPLLVKTARPGAPPTELEGWNTAVEREKIALSTGYSMNEVSDTVMSAFGIMPNNRLLLRGGAGELVRASRWRRPIGALPSDDVCFDQYTRQPVEKLNATLGKERVADIRARYDAWRAALPSGQQNIHDLSHIELWMSGQPSTFFYATRRTFMMNPFGERDLLHRILRFPLKTRKSGRLVTKILNRLSPGIADCPYATQIIRDRRKTA